MARACLGGVSTVDYHLLPFKITEKKDIAIGRIFAVADSEVIVAAEDIRMKLLYMQPARIVKYIIAACLQLAGAHDDSVVEAFVEELVGIGGAELAVGVVSAELTVGVVTGFGETGKFHA